MLNMNPCLIHVMISFDLFLLSILFADICISLEQLGVGTPRLGYGAVEKVRALRRLAEWYS